ncbi:MAG: hypothetical protein COB83_04115 [Gammaproteobacteria bacterium]|nr:MAG: hypothetical protein COB83_04115 [Gammaproteobacteria bacterium]
MNNYCDTRRILNKAQIKKSSALINKVLGNPAKYFKFTIDGLSMTIPLESEDVRSLKCLPALIESETEFTVIAKTHSHKEVKTTRFFNQIQIINNEGHSFSLFYSSMMNSEMNKKKWEHKKTYNEGKIDVNVNTFGVDNTKIILSLVKKLWPAYDDLIARSRITVLDYTADIPKMFTPHLITTYAYRSLYRGFVKDGLFTGHQYGLKAQCPIKVYDKSAEQEGQYLRYTDYTRFEKTYRPAIRGNKKILISALETADFNFRGLRYYDPKLLIGMPDHVLHLLLEHGLDSGKCMLSTKDSINLKRRMDKHLIKLNKAQRFEIRDGLKSQLTNLKDLLLHPDS